jgi:RNA polymerase sigma-70 factor (ECF subfamily)
MAVPFGRRRSDALSDADAIARVLDGDKQQFEHLVRRYQHVLYRHAVSIVLDHDAAADMVQDAFVRAYLNLRECRDTSRFRAWLFRTLRNRCFDHLKAASRRNVPLDDVEPIPLDEADGPAALAERSETRTAIRRALATLPPVLREAFVMHYVDGIPYETMAELLGASVSAIKMRALRAREALSSALGQENVTGASRESSLSQVRRSAGSGSRVFEEE